MKFIPRSDATRQLIIESTAEVFNKKGFAGTSIADMEKATGLSKGSIYGNFENKDAVALAVLDYNLDNKLTVIQAQVDKKDSFKDKLLAHVLIHYPAAKSPFIAGGCPMMNTITEADDTHEELRKKAADGLLRWTDAMVDIIKGGVRANEFKENTDATGTALHIISLIEGGVLYVKATQDMKYAKKMLDMAKQLIADLCI